MEETSERLLRAIWRHLETPRRHPGSTQEAPRDTQNHPGGTQEVRGLWDTKKLIIARKGVNKVPRPGILVERGEGDPHQVRSLSAKVGGRHVRAEPAITPPSL